MLGHMAALGAHRASTAPHPDWGSLGAPLADVFVCAARHADCPAATLARCAQVCRGWRAALAAAAAGAAPWAAALEAQFG